MEEEERIDEGRDCSSCGGTITDEDLAKGRAFRREGKVFCRRCMRKEFPDECRNHPGVKAQEKCAMCRSPYCSDCLVSISEVKVCEKCKPAVLEMLKDGEDIGKPGALKLSKRPWERVIPETIYEVAERVLPTRFYIPVAVAAIVVILLFKCTPSQSIFMTPVVMWYIPVGILLGYWYASRSVQIRRLTIDESGITAETARVRTKKLPWDAVKSARIGGKWIVVTGNGPTIRLRRSAFRRHDLIADAIRESCRQKRIPCKG
jgi:hypothetical protein